MLDHRKAYYLLVGFFCFIGTISAQNQKLADSLKRIYQSGLLKDSSQLELLRNLSFNEVNDLHLSLKYAEELIDLSNKYQNNIYLYRGYLQKGNKNRLLGNLDEALDSYFKAAETAKIANFSSGEGSAYGAIADIYSVSENHKNAIEYYEKSISTLRQAGDEIPLASAISNAGDELVNQKEYDAALNYFNESGALFEKANYAIGKAYTLGNIGMVYAHKGNNALAEKNLSASIRILEKLEDYYPICVYLIYMSDIYRDQGNTKKAMDYATRSLNLAEKYNLKEQISDASNKLSELYFKSGNTSQSLIFYKKYIAYKDSVNDIRTVRKMADLRTDFEVSQKQTEVDLLNKEKQNQRTILTSLFIILVLVTTLLGTLFWYFRNIAKEKKRSENLLLNILPEQTAKELKLNGKVEATKFEVVTVLFTDFVEFSKLAEQIQPEQLVKSLDYYFRKFDQITTSYGLEKIKTIGDSYMCAGGLPTPNKTHAKDVIRAAMEIIAFINEEFTKENEIHKFDVRIGINSGPVVAGIVGIKKWQYDIWGDTVNIASRLESKSLPGKINISETTYLEIKDEFKCEYRGEFEVKNRGHIKMYFLK
ncbi:MAG: adenylate/guanylate cyclase domain-containing protein [Saprospiraceae bacterium]